MKESGKEDNQKRGGDVIKSGIYWMGVSEENAGDQVIQVKRKWKYKVIDSK